MATSSFLIYISTFFAGAIASVLVVKNFAQGFAVNAKKPVIEGGLSALLASAVTYVTLLFTERLFTIYWIFAGIFLLLGVIQILVFHKKYFYSDNRSKGRVVLGEILFMLALLFFIIVVFSSLVYFLKKETDYQFFPMLMSMLAFFLPLSVVHAFDAAYNIPPSEFPLWQYPNSPIELPDEKPNEKLLLIAFELFRTTNDKTTTNFRAKGPDAMKLGDLFYHFINDYNEVQSEATIQYADDDYSPHEWGFRIKGKWYQPHIILDPELTVRENRIMENSVIICDRI